MSLMRKTLLALSESHWIYRFIVSHRFSRDMARRFIAGETLEEAVEAIRQVNANRMQATFDHLGENVSTLEEAAAAVRIYLHILEKIHETGIQSNVSLKLTELGLDLSERACQENLERILQKAESLGNFIRIDMEGSPYTERTLSLFKRVYDRHKNVGVVIQAYLYRSEKDLDELIDLGARIRLCKGAYNEPPNLAFPKKKEVDDHYVKLMKILLLHGNYPALATHDQQVIEAARSFAQEQQIEPARYEFQMLYGIRRDLQEELVREGYNVRIYVPYGRQWYPYFMRRLAERPANLMFFLTSLIRG